MRLLPLVLVTVDVPRLLSPSALGAAGGCALRLVASSPGVRVDRLPSGPDAAVGILVHRVVEYWTRARGSSNPHELFDAEYTRLRAELEEDPGRRHFAELASTKGPQAWARLRDWATERCRNAERRVPQGSTATLRTAIPQGVPLGPERPLSSERLRLGGQVDRIRQVGTHAYEIRDLKSGNVLGEDGEVKAAIQLQLRAYALMVLDLDPKATVRLVVDDGDEREVAFDASDPERADRLSKALS